MFAADQPGDPVGAGLAAWTVSFVTRLAALLEEWRGDGVLGSHVDSTAAAFSAFAHYYLALVSWLGSSAITAGLRDTLLERSLRQAVRGLGPQASVAP